MSTKKRNKREQQPLTAEEIAQIKELGWINYTDLARLARKHPATIYKWFIGNENVPPIYPHAVRISRTTSRTRQINFQDYLNFVNSNVINPKTIIN